MKAEIDKLAIMIFYWKGSKLTLIMLICSPLCISLSLSTGLHVRQSGRDPHQAAAVPGFQVDAETGRPAGDGARGCALCPVGRRRDCCRCRRVSLGCSAGDGLGPGRLPGRLPSALRLSSCRRRRWKRSSVPPHPFPLFVSFSLRETRDAHVYSCQEVPSEPFLSTGQKSARGPLGAAWFLCWGLTDRLVQAALFLADSDLGPPHWAPSRP